MAGRHRNWHRAWRRGLQGELVHESGLVMLPIPDGTGAKYQPALDTIGRWERYERARGVRGEWQLDRRLARLFHEAEIWEDPEGRKTA